MSNGWDDVQFIILQSLYVHNQVDILILTTFESWILYF